MADCQALEHQLDFLIEQRNTVQEELQNTSDPSERATLIAWLKSLNRQIAAVRRQYDACLNPPLPKPDLVATTFQIRPNHAAQTMDIACVIQNNGDGPARGPFEVVLGVSYKNRQGTIITRQLNIHIPNGVTIEGHGTEYTTEAIQNIPLLYRDENPDFVYDLEMIVDATNQVAEVSESNNYFGFRYWTVRPAINTVLELNGSWTDGSPRRAVISVAFNSLTIDMAAFNRPAAQGSIVDASTITVTFPDDATYTGHLHPPNTISWSNGSAWTKV